MSPLRNAEPRMDFGGFGKKVPVKADAKAGEVAEVPFEVRFSIGNLISGSGALLFVFCIVRRRNLFERVRSLP